MDVEGAPGAAAGVDWLLLLLLPLLQVCLAGVPHHATFRRSRRPTSLPDDANIDYLYLYTRPRCPLVRLSVVSVRC